jgi:hypothetical protein
MHLDARALAVEEGVALEGRKIDLGAGLAVDALGRPRMSANDA